MGLNRYNSRDEVYVSPFAGTSVRYGFLTNVNVERRSVLGHTNVDRANLPQGLVFGANAPKPGRASRKFTDGFASSFYDISQVAALRSGGWSLTRPSIRRARTTPLSESYFVTINGVKYAWMMPTVVANRISGDLAGLGVQAADANDRDLVWGAQYPKPSRASRVLDDGSEVDRLTTFVDPSRVESLPAGWQITGREYVL